MKTCPDCKTAKPFVEFYRHAKRPDGCSPYCKRCTEARLKVSRQNKTQRSATGVLMDRLQGTFELHCNDILEGVFSSISEVADYLNCRRSTVTALLSADYDEIRPFWHKYMVVQIFDQKEYATQLAIRENESEEGSGL